VVTLWAADGAPAPKSNVRDLATTLGGQVRAGDVVIAAHPEQIGVARHYLGARPAYATTLGPQADARAMDWREALARLRAADPPETLARVRSAGARRRVLLLLPVVADTENRGTPWISLVHRRALAWERLLDAEPGLRRTTVLPRPGDPTPPSRGARAVLYVPV
jgi:hypothetical protein